MEKWYLKEIVDKWVFKGEVEDSHPPRNRENYYWLLLNRKGTEILHIEKSKEEFNKFLYQFKSHFDKKCCKWYTFEHPMRKVICYDDSGFLEEMYETCHQAERRMENEQRIRSRRVPSVQRVG